jgi:hypothetical protein
MNRRLTVALLTAALVVPGLQAADEKLPTADEVLDRYIEVTGGKAAYEKRKSEIATVGVEIAGQGIKGTMTRYADQSNNSYMAGEFEGVGRMEEGVFNGQAWEVNPMMGPRLKSGEENATAVRDARFNGPLEWKKLYKGEVVGVEKAGDEDAYKLVLTPIGDGRPQTMWFSKKTGFLTRMERTIVSPMGEAKMQQTLRDYQPMGSTLAPKKISQNIMGMQIEVTIQDVKEDAEIPAGRFDPPADVKKLMAK